MWACVGSKMFQAEITPINNHGNGLTRPQRAEWINMCPLPRCGTTLHYCGPLGVFNRLENNRF